MQLASRSDWGCSHQYYKLIHYPILAVFLINKISKRQLNKKKKLKQQESIRGIGNKSLLLITPEFLGCGVEVYMYIMHTQMEHCSFDSLQTPQLGD